LQRVPGQPEGRTPTYAFLSLIAARMSPRRRPRPMTKPAPNKAQQPGSGTACTVTLSRTMKGNGCPGGVNSRFPDENEWPGLKASSITGTPRSSLLGANTWVSPRLFVSVTPLAPERSSMFSDIESTGVEKDKVRLPGGVPSLA